MGLDALQTDYDSTQEAFDSYLGHLHPDGILAIHGPGAATGGRLVGEESGLQIGEEGLRELEAPARRTSPSQRALARAEAPLQRREDGRLRLSPRPTRHVRTYARAEVPVSYLEPEIAPAEGEAAAGDADPTAADAV